MKNFTSTRLVPQSLRSIYDKVVAAERIDDQEAVQLYRSTDINALGLSRLERANAAMIQRAEEIKGCPR